MKDAAYVFMHFQLPWVKWFQQMSAMPFSWYQIHAIEHHLDSVPPKTRTQKYRSAGLLQGETFYKQHEKQIAVKVYCSEIKQQLIFRITNEITNN